MRKRKNEKRKKPRGYDLDMIIQGRERRRERWRERGREEENERKRRRECADRVRVERRSRNNNDINSGNLLTLTSATLMILGCLISDNGIERQREDKMIRRLRTEFSREREFLWPQPPGQSAHYLDISLDLITR